jgi:enoyl-CoA hydratase/carnithine racemase
MCCVFLDRADGYAMGGGAELTTVADFRVMAPHARLQFVQVRVCLVAGALFP